MVSPGSAVRRAYPVQNRARIGQTSPNLGTLAVGKWIGSVGSSWVWMGRGRCTAVSPFQGLWDPGVIFPGRRPSPTRGLPWAVFARPVGALGGDEVRSGFVSAFREVGDGMLPRANVCHASGVVGSGG